MTKSGTQRRSRTRFAAALVAMALGVAVVGGCSSSGSDKAVDSGSSATPAANVAEAQALLAKVTSRPTSIGITESPGPVPAGKTVAFIQCSVPSCVLVGNYLKAAVQAVGWKWMPIDAGDGSDPAKVKAAWSQAVRSKPDAVVGTGFPNSVMQPELDQLQAAGIPVLMGSNGNEPKKGDGVFAYFNNIPSYTGIGTAMADYAYAKTGGKTLTSLYVDSPGFPINGFEGKGYAAEYKRLCPDCKLETLDVPNSSIGSDFPARVVAYLRTHPDVEVVAPAFDDMLQGFPNALATAGLAEKPLVVTQGVNNLIASYLKQNAVGGSVYQDWQNWMWRMVDLLIRHWNGKPYDQDLDPTTIANWVVTGDNLPSDDGDFPPMADYQDQWKKLWGVN